MHKTIHILIVMLGIGIISNQALASSVTIPTTFSSGTPALAAEVNANFSAAETAVNDNDTRITGNDNRIATLEASVATLLSTISTLQSDLSTANSTISALQTGLSTTDGNVSTLQSSLSATDSNVSTLQTNLSAVEGNSVLALDGNLTYSVDAYGYATALFSGINVQVINGVAQTTPNGLGNLIVGYNNSRTGGSPMCSDGQYTDQTSCTNAGETWGLNQKTGSHNLIAGDRNSYTRTGGIVFGYQNVIHGNYANVSGGIYNRAYGFYSQVSGGNYNTASGNSSSVSGGYANTASGIRSSVSGGNTRSATGNYDWAAGSLFETQ